MSIVRIALDAMGGDFAPAELVKGAVSAFEEERSSFELILVGDRGRIQQELEKFPQVASLGIGDRLKIVEATETIGMDEGAAAVRKKKDASINVAMELIKKGEADAVVALGSTGAAMVSALLHLGRIEGVERPAIAVPLPTKQGPCLLLDVGANVDSKPFYLRQFASMGSIYAQRVLGIERPRVGLLNIGEEPGKGNELAIACYQQLAEASDIHFVGNVEGRELMTGRADVVVCDGFVGNVVLKCAEGFADLFQTMLGEAIMARGLVGRLGAILLRASFRQLKRRLDYSEYGGALLLGVNGVCVIGHGSSKAYAVENAIRVARQAVAADAIGRMASVWSGGEESSR